MLKSRFFVALLACLFACGPSPDGQINREKVKEEIENRELKRISEAEIIAGAYTAGNLLANAADKGLAKKMEKAIMTHGAPASLQYCSLEDIKALDSLLNVYGANMKRVSFLKKNSPGILSETEAGLLEAYRYEAENNGKLNPNVQPLENGDLLYSAPILLNNNVCLQCHGTSGNEIGEATLSAIRINYPNDSIILHEKGDLLGIYSIKLSKKEIIKSF